MTTPDPDNWWEGLVPERIVLEPDAFDELVRMLEDEPREIPTLRRLFERSRRIEWG